VNIRKAARLFQPPFLPRRKILSEGRHPGWELNPSGKEPKPQKALDKVSDPDHNQLVFSSKRISPENLVSGSGCFLPAAQSESSGLPLVQDRGRISPNPISHFPGLYEKNYLAGTAGILLKEVPFPSGSRFLFSNTFSGGAKLEDSHRRGRDDRRISLPALE
jgi:hypothetical protein